MIRPFTCICLMLAAGSGLYLYQVKQRAFKLEAELRTTFHDIDVAREKTRMLRADWALMNDPERLQTLAAQYLTLKPMAPAQLMTLDQLAAVLPPPEAPGTEHPPSAPPPGSPAITPAPGGIPMAAATLPSGAGASIALGAGATGSGAPPAETVALLQPGAAGAASTGQTVLAGAALGPQGSGSGSGSGSGALPALPDATAAGAAAGAAAAAAIAVLPPPAAPPAPPLPAFAAAPALVPSGMAAGSSPASLAFVPPASAPHAPARPAAGLPGAHLAAMPPRHIAPVALIHHPAHSPAHPAAAPRQPRPAAPQYFAANEPVHAPVMARILPAPAAVIYRPTASALGMAGGATLAPPRPLYSTTQ